MCAAPSAAPQKTPSPLRSLADGSALLAADREECTWNVVSVDKIVSRECHVAKFGAAIQESAPSSACLDACGGQKTNASSWCWTDCFYKAALGPESGTPGGKVAGLSVEEMTAAWEKPFLPEEQGGCPALKELPPWFERP